MCRQLSSSKKQWIYPVLRNRKKRRDNSLNSKVTEGVVITGDDNKKKRGGKVQFDNNDTNSILIFIHDV